MMKLKFAVSFLLILYCALRFSATALAQSQPNSDQELAQPLPKEIIVAVDSAQNEGRAKILLPIAEDIAKQLGVKVSYYSCPWARCLKAIEKGKVDLIFSVFRTKARDAYMHFISPALATHDVSFHFLIKKDRNITIDNYQDLATITIATLRGNQYFKRFDADKTLNKFAAVDYQSAVNMVINNRVEAMIDLSLTPATQVAAADPEQRLSHANYTLTEGIDEYIALSKTSAWGSHSELISKALRQLTLDGTINEYFKQVAELERQG